jgi:curved DNA-binding protein CbpA
MVTVMQAPQPGGPVPDLYRVLGVARDASRADIAHAYRREVRATHPDSHPQEAGDPARFRALAEAYKVLSDPARRSAYDRAVGPPPASAASSPAAQVPPAWPAGPGRMPAARTPGPPLWAGPARIDPPDGRPARYAPREGYAEPGERDLLALIADLADWYRPW